jgi:hypothetical protein
MTEKELEILLHKLVEEKFNVAFEKLKTFHKCEQLYNEMCLLGYYEPMKAFKNIVLYSIILNPEITEEELLIDFYNKMNK